MPLLREEFSDTESEDDFNDDMEALKRACQITGKNPADNNLQLISTADATASPKVESDGEGDEDLELVRSIQDRFAVPMDLFEDEPLVMKPLCTLPPDWSDVDDCEDDYETLRAIQRRFSAYNEDGMGHNMDDLLHRPAQVGSSIIDSEKESSNSFVEKTNVRQGFLNCVDASVPASKKAGAHEDAGRTQPADLVEWDGPDTEDVAGLPFKSSEFPKCALAFIDAIKKNRSCQKLVRSKMIQVEARVEELSKLMERVKILKDFQIACKKRTGRALSQKKDACVQLISLPKLRAKAKFNEKIPAYYKGPPENAHVAYYKEALTTFAINVTRENWSKEEKENLIKGVKQQFQEMLLQQSVDLLSDENGSYDPGRVDSILVSIRDTDITPDQMRSFLPKVNWEKLAAMYLPGRSGAECEARFLNFDDPLINHKPWTAMEDKAILHTVQQKGLNNWIDIAASLGTNRTPFQCLARYQRSLNASILKREWTKEEDGQLRTAVETYGESNWQAVASMMEGRTGTQCSNRWLKTLHPARKVVGKWTKEEDIRLKVSVALFGPKMWKSIAKFVPGRTQVQCRERWVNCLDPSLSTAQWTEEEDTNLEMAVAEHGYCWSKVAACIPRRTDNQCWRRWKVLFPDEVPVLQAARKIRKALISNFVDREAERPALGPNDFVMPEEYCITASKNIDPSNRKRRRSSKQRAEHECDGGGDTVSGDICSEKVSKLSERSEVENLQGGSVPSKRKSKSSRSINKNADPSSGVSSPCPDTALVDMFNDGNIKRKLRRQKKKLKSSLDSGPADEPHTNINEHPTPTEECLLPDLQLVTINPEHGVKKAVTLQYRRRRHPVKTIGTAGEGSITTNETNYHEPSPFPDSMLLREAISRIKAMKMKMKARQTHSRSPPFDSIPMTNTNSSIGSRK
ncbi:myb domain protein 4r1 [Striga asiatica]|uniref:Myb domain protein 4r1 n=1 Tax=Striga asiatica TaxID=4170 RepID=A0A5A7PI66_STRAF|nr:myb domain protein 4r1 [Striga asiatica]